jgi:hypothetical protein
VEEEERVWGPTVLTFHFHHWLAWGPSASHWHSTHLNFLIWKCGNKGCFGITWDEVLLCTTSGTQHAECQVLSHTVFPVGRTGLFFFVINGYFFVLTLPVSFSSQTTEIKKIYCNLLLKKF